jgi:hypothetical protein
MFIKLVVSFALTSFLPFPPPIRLPPVFLYEHTSLNVEEPVKDPALPDVVRIYIPDESTLLVECANPVVPTIPVELTLPVVLTLSEESFFTLREKDSREKVQL